MLDHKRTDIVHWIWDKDGPDYDVMTQSGGFIYEWTEGNEYVNVWPKGQFKYPPESGNIWLDHIIDEFDSNTFTKDMLLAFLIRHENSEFDSNEDYYSDPEV